MRWTGLMSTAFLLMSVAPSGLSPAAPLPSEVRTGLLVTVGDVTDTTAMLWVRGDGAVPVTARYRPAGDPRPVEVGIALEPRADFTGRVALSELAPGTRYHYEVAQGGETIHGTFGTAPAPDARAPARVLWSGDLGGANNCRDVEDGYRIFDAMSRRRADLFLFVGDTIYADHTCGRALHVPGASFVAETLYEFHAKHRYNREDPVVQRFLRTTPVEAIWDDHEVRNNFAGPSEPLMPVGRRAFLDYWPIRAEPADPARLYRRVRWGRDLDIFILDTRQYRTANDGPDGPAKTMLGSAQRAWLLDGLRRSDATWKLIVSTVPLGQFTGGKVADSWSGSNVLGFTRPGKGFTHERDTLLEALRGAHVKNVVVLSGDVHHGELIRHEPSPGFVVHEFLAGPLAARQGFKRFLDRSLNSRSLGSLGWTNNFGEITVDGGELAVRLLDTAGATRVSFRLGAEPPVMQARRDAPRAVHTLSGGFP